MSGIHVALVDERDSSWEEHSPRFRVYLHEGGGCPSTSSSTATYDITGADVLQVIDWAQRQAGSTGTYAVALVCDVHPYRGEPADRGLVWLVGMDENDNPWDDREAAAQARMLARRTEPVGVPAADRMPADVGPRPARRS